MVRYTLAIVTFALGLFLRQNLHAEESPTKCHKCSIWAEVDYLYWWIKDSPEPVSLIFEEPLGIDLGEPLDVVGAKLVLGGKDVDLGARSGARFDIGSWINEYAGLQALYLLLPTQSKTKSVSSDGQLGSNALILPFFDVTTGMQNIALIAFPGDYAGEASLKISNFMQSAELNLLGSLYCKNAIELFALAGFQWWNFNEHLTFETSSPNIAPPLDILLTKDRFETRNNFYGGLVGLHATFTRRWFQFEMAGKIALGSMNSNLKIQGELVTNLFNGFGETETFLAGYFALPTNEGTFKRNRFAIIPEMNVNLGFKFINAMRLEIGYTLLYATKVLWSGNTIDQNLNPSQSPAITMTPSTTLVGPARPKPLFKTESFWAQGLNVGLKFCF